MRSVVWCMPDARTCREGTARFETRVLPRRIIRTRCPIHRKISNAGAYLYVLQGSDMRALMRLRYKLHTCLQYTDAECAQRVSTDPVSVSLYQELSCTYALRHGEVLSCTVVY